MNEAATISKFNTRIIEIYSEQQLTSLRGTAPDPDDHWLFEGINLHSRYYDVVQATTKFDRFSIFDELTELSDQIVYFTAHTFLYVPYVNNPLHHGVQPPGYDQVIYLNYQNLAAKRYNFYVDTVAEKLYGYWTRLGHLLNAYVPQPLKSKLVDFSRVIDQLEKQLPQYQSHPGYVWLKSFKDNEQGSLNRERSVIVHHVSTATAFQNAYRQAGRQALEAAMVERLSRPELYKEHITLSLRALSKALDLIEAINSTSTPAIP